MEQLATVVARSARALLSVLPVEVAVGFTSLVALAVLIRAARGAPLNSAFARRLDGASARGLDRPGTCKAPAEKRSPDFPWPTQAVRNSASLRGGLPRRELPTSSSSTRTRTF